MSWRQYIQCIMTLSVRVSYRYFSTLSTSCQCECFISSRLYITYIMSAGMSVSCHCVSALSTLCSYISTRHISLYACVSRHRASALSTSLIMSLRQYKCMKNITHWSCRCISTGRITDVSIEGFHVVVPAHQIHHVITSVHWQDVLLMSALKSVTSSCQCIKYIMSLHHWVQDVSCWKCALCPCVRTLCISCQSVIAKSVFHDNVSVHSEHYIASRCVKHIT